MNYILADFKKTITKHIIVEGDEITVNQVSLAKELSGKVERFWDWYAKQDKFIMCRNADFDQNIMPWHFKDFEIPENWNIKYTLSDLYKYFIEEIDGK